MKHFWRLAVVAVWSASAVQAATVQIYSEVNFPSSQLVNAGVPKDMQFLDLFVTTDYDILSVNQVNLDLFSGSLFQFPHPFGSDLAPPPPEFIALHPELEADSWITTPGRTSLLGPDLEEANGTSTFGDLTSDGAQEDFHFARISVPPGTQGTFSGRVSVAGSRGPEVFPFSYELPPVIVEVFLPDIPNGSTIDLTQAYYENEGLAPEAINFYGIGGIVDVSLSNQSVPGLFGASIGPFTQSIDLTVDPVIGRTVPAGTVATADLQILENGALLSYSLVAFIPEPSSLALVSFILLPMMIGFRYRREYL